MADDTGTQDDAPDTGTDQDSTEEQDQRVPYDRFKAANDKAKAAADKAAALEKQLNDLTAKLQEREDAGLPELERERKRAEALEARIKEAEERADKAEAERVRGQRERLVLAAASKANFDDPSDALRFSDIVDLDSIEDADQAERAIKRLAKAKPRLLKDDDPGQPQIGRVLEGGKSTKNTSASEIDPESEAAMIAGALKKFVRN